MSAATVRADIIRLARHDGGASRGARYLARRRGERGRSFAALCAAPRWPVLEEEARIRIGAVALLLTARSALAREIDGDRLRAYADIVGFPVLERMLAQGGRGDAPLPSAEELADAARRFVAGDDPHLGERLRAAEQFMREAGEWPST